MNHLVVGTYCTSGLVHLVNLQYITYKLLGFDVYIFCINQLSIYHLIMTQRIIPAHIIILLLIVYIEMSLSQFNALLLYSIRARALCVVF